MKENDIKSLGEFTEWLKKNSHSNEHKEATSCKN